MSKSITQDILHSELSSFEQKIDVKLEKMREENKQYKDEILGKLDETMGELGAMRDENTIGSGQTSQLREQAEDHEKRIKHLEKIQQIADTA